MNTKTTVFNKSNLILLCTVVALYHMSLSLLRFFFDMTVFYYIDTVFCTAIVIFAVLYIAARRPTITVDKDVCLLLIMLLYLLISCITRTISSGNDWLSPNSFYIVDLEILIIVYILGKHYSESGIPSYLVNIFHIIILVWSAVILFLLVNLFTNRLVTAPSGATLCGTDSRFFVLDCNRNHTGAYSGVFLLLSVCMFTWCKNKILRLFYIPAAVINYVLLVLSNSKTALLSTITGFSLIIGVLTFRHFKNMSLKKLLPFSILSGIFSGTVFFLMRYAITALYSAVVRHFSGTELAARTILDSSAARLSGRIGIWKVSANLMFSRRFLMCGVTPYGVFNDIADITNNANRSLNTHNQFLEIGTSMGLPALISFLIWCGIIIIACWHIYSVKKDKTDVLLLPLLLAAFFVMSLTEAYLMFYEHFVAYVFFFICGVIYNRAGLRIKPLFRIDLQKTDRNKN